jgi:hypothetical protein
MLFQYDPLIILTVKLQNSSLSGAHVSASKPLFKKQPRGMTSAILHFDDAPFQPRLETLADITKNHFAVRATDARPFTPEGGWPADFDVAPYRQQIHPITGETLNQMADRAQPFIKTKNLGEHVALDYSDLPADLMFDPKCGVRWKTTAEMAETQAEVDRIFDAVQDGTAQIVRDGTGEVMMVFLPTPADEVRVLNPEPKPAYFSGITDDSAQASADVKDLFAEAPPISKGLQLTPEQSQQFEERLARPAPPTEAMKNALDKLRFGAPVVNAEPTAFSVLEGDKSSVQPAPTSNLTKIHDGGTNGNRFLPPSDE